ncbi:alpha/beta hydrolase [Nocardioides lentus]|uniref:alpha/beta hydrolase n=1 Tax=Nocardioides lentus TaxID=338077 RepID=UPI0031DCDF80
MRAKLIDVRVPTSPRGAVLVLHGGGDRPGSPPVSPTQLSVLRMVPVARRIARAGRGALAVHRLLNSHRGWDAETTPVADATWALGRVRERYGDVPVCLVGHSLGGRAALLAGSAAGVAGVVALNPWVYADEAAHTDLAGRRVLVVHGTDDRIADPRRARRVVADLERRGVDATMVEVAGGKHAMLARGAEFERRTADFAVEVLR